MCFNVNIMEPTKGHVLINYSRVILCYKFYNYQDICMHHSTLLKCKQCASLKPKHVYIYMYIELEEHFNQSCACIAM